MIDPIATIRGIVMSALWWWNAEQNRKLDAILASLGRVEKTLGTFKAGATVAGELDKLEADVAAQETVEASVVTLLGTLKSELDAAIAAGDMTRVAAVSAKIEADTAALSAAVVANTPTPPAPPAPTA